MQCQNCKTINDNEYIYCVNCGLTISGNPGAGMGQIQNPRGGVYRGGQSHEPPSVETQFVPPTNYGQAVPVFNPGGPQYNVEPRKTRSKAWIFVAFGVLLFLLLGGIAAAFLVRSRLQPGETLPDHLGLFYQNKEKTVLNELKKYESASIPDAKDHMVKDESLPVVNERPDIILYADGNDVPVADIKLIPLDSIKNDGTIRQIEFQASPVEGNPAMKRLRLTDSLAIGKYAFAKIDGYFDEGKHRFWAFEIKTADKKDNGDTAKETVVATKPKPAVNTPVQKTPPLNLPTVAKLDIPVPTGAKLAYCNESNVVVRSAPSLTAKKVNGLRRGQKLFVMQYSDNTDNWRGVQANWAYIQTENGKSGWVFSPFISY